MICKEQLLDHSRYVRVGDSQVFSSYFEERLRAKADRGNFNRHHSLSSGDAYRNESRRKLDDFEARLQRKIEQRKSTHAEIVPSQTMSGGWLTRPAHQ